MGQQHQVEDSMHDNNNNNTNNTPVPNSVVHVMARVPSDPIPPPQLIQSPTLEPAVFRGGDGDDEQSNQPHLMPPDLGEALGIKSSSSDSLSRSKCITDKLRWKEMNEKRKRKREREKER